MKHRILAAALLAALASAAAHAAPQDGGPRQARWQQLDTNGDGAVDRTEAARSPRLAEGFDRLDRNGDGRLQADELRHGRADGRGHRGPGGAMGGGVDAFARFDADGDGRISRAELERAQAEREARAAQRPARPERAERGPRADGADRPQRPDLLAQFDAIDADRDGLIGRAELRAWFEAQRPQREAEAARRFDERFAEADLNRDGKLSRVEVQEKMPRLAERFAWRDENGDGFLSREELRPPQRR
ncbi:EF-hand domain-containing protein [Luteimonas sp. Y-2-2-4F]|nr:EF-hand domain-containing protein [Luteimonas sp. Y-2-2-4F]MCD9033523.1 EF-hand domain-containing protein [Luteimonas sp. Y-2-2-4F]